MSTSRKLLIGLGLLAIVALTIALRTHFAGSSPALPPEDARLNLNESQKRQIFEPGKDWVTVYRYRSHEVWQVALDPEAGSGGTAIGRLYRSPKPPEVGIALYLCDFGSAKRPNVVLDVQKDCSRHGKSLEPAPVGYGSEKIRTGYRLIFRCKSQEHGTYLSFKSDCEGEGDRVETDLAAFRAVDE